MEQNVYTLGNIGVITIGLSWDMLGSTKVDLDASCVFFDGYGRIVDAVFYNQLDVGFAIHSGDNKTGEGEGFDETILVNLSKMCVSKPKIESFMVVVNCYSGGNFLNVETAEAQVIDNTTNNIMTEVSVGCKGSNTGLILCMFFKEGQIWKFKEIGKACQGRNFKDVEKEMKEEMRFLVPEELEHEMKWDKSCEKSFEMKKGDELNLGELKGVMMGLGWDTKCDLDASVIEVKINGDAGETIYYGRKRNKNESIRHHGDNLTGDGEGDDERISVNLDEIDNKVGFLVFMVNVFSSGMDFGDVKGAYSRLVWEDNQGGPGREVCRFNLSDRERGEGMVMAIVYREDHENWKFRAVGEEVRGNTSNLVEALKFISHEDLVRMKQVVGSKHLQNLGTEIEGKELELENLPQMVPIPNTIRIKCRADKVDKMDLFGKSDPFYVIKNEYGRELYRSEIVKVTLYPKWRETVVRTIEGSQVYTVEVYDWDKFSSDDLIGSFTFVPEKLSEQGETTFEIINEKKRKKKKKRYTNSGVFVFERCRLNVMEKSQEYVELEKEISELKREFGILESMIK